MCLSVASAQRLESDDDGRIWSALSQAILHYCPVLLQTGLLAPLYSFHPQKMEMACRRVTTSSNAVCLWRKMMKDAHDKMRLKRPCPWSGSTQPRCERDSMVVGRVSAETCIPHHQINNEMSISRILRCVPCTCRQRLHKRVSL